MEEQDTQKNSCTFADESFVGGHLDDTVVVGAQVPSDIDLRWYHELRKKIRPDGKEVKYRDLKRKRPDLGIDLNNAILRGIGSALIVISDPSSYIKKVEKEIQLARTLPSLQRKRLMAPINHYVAQMTMSESPLRWVMPLADTEASDTVWIDSSGPLKNIHSKVESVERSITQPFNARLYACRANCSWYELVDDETRKRIFDKFFSERRYFVPSQFWTRLLVEAQQPERVFDNGNSAVVASLNNIRKWIDDDLQNVPFLGFQFSSGAVRQADSALVEQVQVSDLAAGFAREMYESAEGLKKVRDHFKRVVFNGTVLK